MVTKKYHKIIQTTTVLYSKSFKATRNVICPLLIFDQMEHYKLDYHRFNLRQRLKGRSAVTVEEFEKKTGTGRFMNAHMTLMRNTFVIQLRKCKLSVFLFLLKGDISSISGSDSDSEDEDLYEEPGDEVVSEEKDSALDTDQSPPRCSTKIVFQNMQGQYLSLYRCVLQSKRVSKCSHHFSDVLICGRSFSKTNPH